MNSLKTRNGTPPTGDVCWRNKDPEQNRCKFQDTGGKDKRPLAPPVLFRDQDKIERENPLPLLRIHLCREGPVSGCENLEVDMGGAARIGRWKIGFNAVSTLAVG